MIQLVVGEVGLKSSQLPIRPPVLLGGEGEDKIWGIGRERALGELRGDY